MTFVFKIQTTLTRSGLFADDPQKKVEKSTLLKNANLGVVTLGFVRFRSQKIHLAVVTFGIFRFSSQKMGLTVVTSGFVDKNFCFWGNGGDKVFPPTFYMEEWESSFLTDHILGFKKTHCGSPGPSRLSSSLRFCSRKMDLAVVTLAFLRFCLEKSDFCRGNARFSSVFSTKDGSHRGNVRFRS